jgi:hypothetical protein
MTDELIRALRTCATALEQLAIALEKERVHNEGAAPAASTWPDRMPTTVAARYCGFKTTGGLRKAFLDGRITPAGRRGGVGSWTWEKTELDRFMSQTPRAVTTTPAPPVESPGTPHRANTRKLGPASEAALRRIKEMTFKR